MHFLWVRHYFYFKWSSEPHEGLAVGRAKAVTSFLSYSKTLRIGLAPGIKPATSRFAVKHLTDWANPTAVNQTNTNKRPITVGLSLSVEWITFTFHIPQFLKSFIHDIERRTWFLFLGVFTCNRIPLTVVGQTERYCHVVDFKLCNCPRQAGKRKQDEELSFMLHNRVNRVSGFFTGGEILRLTQQFIEQQKTIKRLTMNENEILDLWWEYIAFLTASDTSRKWIDREGLGKRLAWTGLYSRRGFPFILI